MIDPGLLAEAQRLINRAQLIAEASAARPPDVRASAARPVTVGHASPHGKQHHHSHPTSAPPPGAFTYETSTLEACGDRINAAIANDSDSELAAANRWATREIDALQHAPEGRAETPVEFGDRIVRDYEGELAGVVARREKSSVTTVRKLREDRGREPKSGYKLAGKGLAGGSR